MARLAQELGLSLDEVADLRRMQRVLKHLMVECEHTDAGRPCPIIRSLSADRH